MTTSPAAPPLDPAESPALSPALLAARAARESVRTLIEAEIRRQDAFPVARRTLQLLAEAVVEPAVGPPFYRIVDRAGAPRRGESGPLTLADLFDELRERHGALFAPVPPKPVVEPVPEPTASDEIKAATFRFVETQSELARSVAARAAARGRAAAAAVSARWSEAVSGVRGRRAETAGTDSSSTLRERSTRLGGSLGDRARETLDLARTRLGALTDGSRATFAAGGRGAGLLGRAADRLGRLRPSEGSPVTRPRTLVGAGIAGGLVILLIVAKSGDTSSVAPTGAPPRQEAQAPAETPPAESPASAAVNVPPAATPPRSAATPPGIPVEEPSPPSADDPPARSPEPSNALTGKTEVIDTATLRVGGKLVRLFGVEWVRGGQPEELTRYLAGRPVSCQPVAGSAAYLCAVDGRDLSEVVLFNGGGRASSEATPDLVAAEDRARTERLGVWAR